jgi:hypothetical protein
MQQDTLNQELTLRLCRLCENTQRADLLNKTAISAGPDAASKLQI